MSKTHKYEPIRIKGEDIPKARKNWGKVKPFTRVKQDKKRATNARSVVISKMNGEIMSNKKELC